MSVLIGFAAGILVALAAFFAIMLFGFTAVDKLDSQHTEGG
jgi:hypothetical protein